VKASLVAGANLPVAELDESELDEPLLLPPPPKML
jgi:hypothetical protein